MQNHQFTPYGVKDCYVTAWFQPELSTVPAKPHPAIVICPGGAYSFVSELEGEPVAKQYYAAGYSTFILNYSVQDKAKNYEPLSQLAATVAHIRKNADQWNIAPSKIAVCGFSAGGHLAASLGVLYNEESFLQSFPQEEDIRPDAMILGYPVITADQFTHQETLNCVSGDALRSTPEYTFWGLDSHVDAQTPPAFIWHTAADEVVPVENSLKLATALSNAKVPYELHILPFGGHGMSVCTHEVDAFDPYNRRWVEWSAAWLNRTLGWEP